MAVHEAFGFAAGLFSAGVKPALTRFTRAGTPRTAARARPSTLRRSQAQSVEHLGALVRRPYCSMADDLECRSGATAGSSASSFGPYLRLVCRTGGEVGAAAAQRA